VDRESAYEKLRDRQAGEAAPAAAGGAPTPADDGGGLLGSLGSILFGKTGPRGGHTPGVIDAAAKSAARSVGSAVGREIVRGVLGSILGGATATRRRR